MDETFDRNAGIGASEWAIALGESPFMSPRKLAMMKRGLVPPPPTTPAMERGNEFEPLIAAHYAKLHPEQRVVLAQKTIMHPTLPYLYATPDYYIEGPDGGYALLECKCHNEQIRKKYGAPYTDEVPIYIWLQAQGQMECTGIDTVIVAPWYGTKDRDEYWIVKPDPETPAVARQVSEWYAKYVLGDTLPEPTAADVQELSRSTAPDARNTVQADDTLAGLVRELRAKSLKLLAAEEAVGDVKAKLMQAMLERNADGLDSPHGLITWRAQTRASVTTDFKRLENEYPEAAAACCTEKTSTYRVFRVPKWGAEEEED